MLWWLFICRTIPIPIPMLGPLDEREQQSTAALVAPKGPGLNSLPPLVIHSFCIAHNVPTKPNSKANIATLPGSGMPGY